MKRRLEQELTDLPDEVAAYASADFSEVNARFVARALELAGGEHRPMRVLDIGCGPGDMPIAIATARLLWSVLGIDASTPMLAIARGRASVVGASNVAFAHADAKAIDPSLGRFDLITSNSLLHHLPDPAGLWRSIRTVGRRGTVVFIRDLARPIDEAATERIVHSQTVSASATLREEYHRSLLAAFTPAEIEEQLARAGLEGMTVAMSSDRHVDVWGILRVD